MKRKEKELEKLKTDFEHYYPFWDEWAGYKFNGLNEMDIYIINIFKSNSFKITHDDALMFYFQETMILEISNKLKRTYSEFQHWLITRFQTYLVQMILLEESENYLLESKKQDSLRVDTVPLCKMNSFTIEEIILITLQKFKVRSLKEIVEGFSENEFRHPDVFKNIIGFMTWNIKKERLVLSE